MTKAMFRGLLGSLLGALVLFAPLRAAEDAKPKAFIVLVGVDNYPDKQIKPRKHAEAERDVEDERTVFDEKIGVAGTAIDHARTVFGGVALADDAIVDTAAPRSGR